MAATRVTQHCLPYGNVRFHKQWSVSNCRKTSDPVSKQSGQIPPPKGKTPGVQNLGFLTSSLGPCPGSIFSRKEGEHA